MCSIVLGEFIEGAEESSWGRGAGRVATGVDVRCRAYCLVSKVEGMLVVVVVEVAEEGGFGVKSAGCVMTVVSTSWDGACEGINHCCCWWSRW